jgi:hypothetical protein
MEMESMRRALSLIAVALLLVAVNGCAKPPQPEIDAAKAAVNGARNAEAGLYADASLRAAEDAVAQLDAELKVQEEKFALFRSYKKATELSAAAKSAGEKAEADAKAGKEMKKNEAMAAISEVKTMLTEVTDMLAKAPRGKGTQADLAAMKADLDGAAAAIVDAENAFASEKYIDAKAKAEAVKQTAMGVKTAIEEAMAARKGR